MRRPAPLFFSLLTTFALVTPLARAQVPVSAADREAARDLFKEGYELQKAGKYPEALDRFRRSNQVFPAPTALLHIAECEVQLLHLVEAVEAYRALTRQPLPPGSPPPFLAAQAQGAAELQQVEPRIPHLRIDVRPPNLPNLIVLLDDQQVNPALLDVARPVDPGQHKVAAMAPGYEKLEGLVTVQEKEPTKTVVLALKPGFSAPPPMMMPPGMGGPGMVAPGMPVQPRVVYVAPPPPPVDAPPPVYYKPKEPEGPSSNTGIFTGVRLGVIVPQGSSQLTNEVAPGFSIGGEFNFRFARRFFVGAVVEHGFLGTPSSVTNTLASLTGGTSSSFSTTNVDGVIGVLTNPDHFGALFQLGGGYRVLNWTATSQSQSSGTSYPGSGEFTVGAGLWIPTGRYFRIVPRIDGTFGSFSGTDPRNSDSATNQVSYGYAMITVNVGGYLNFDFANKAAAAAPKGGEASDKPVQ